jgi:hypothetical protein
MLPKQSLGAADAAGSNQTPQGSKKKKSNA